MTELLPNGDKVEISLIDETVTVPDGKVWVVTIAARSGESDVILENESGDSQNILDGSDSKQTNIAQDITVHEGWVIGAFGTNCLITGWQFDYSE